MFLSKINFFFSKTLLGVINISTESTDWVKIRSEMGISCLQSLSADSRISRPSL